jgi:hypothetical protein
MYTIMRNMNTLTIQNLLKSQSTRNRMFPPFIKYKISFLIRNRTRSPTRFLRKKKLPCFLMNIISFPNPPRRYIHYFSNSMNEIYLLYLSPLHSIEFSSDSVSSFIFNQLFYFLKGSNFGITHNWFTKKYCII